MNWKFIGLAGIVFGAMFGCAASSWWWALVGAALGGMGASFDDANERRYQHWEAARRQDHDRHG